MRTGQGEEERGEDRTGRGENRTGRRGEERGERREQDGEEREERTGLGDLTVIPRRLHHRGVMTPRAFITR
jgi:hypothetical protein